MNNSYPEYNLYLILTSIFRKWVLKYYSPESWNNKQTKSNVLMLLASVSYGSVFFPSFPPCWLLYFVLFCFVWIAEPVFSSLLQASTVASTFPTASNVEAGFMPGRCQGVNLKTLVFASSSNSWLASISLAALEVGRTQTDLTWLMITCILIQPFKFSFDILAFPLAVCLPANAIQRQNIWYLVMEVLYVVLPGLFIIYLKI